MRRLKAFKAFFGPIQVILYGQSCTSGHSRKHFLQLWVIMDIWKYDYMKLWLKDGLICYVRIRVLKTFSTLRNLAPKYFHIRLRFSDRFQKLKAINVLFLEALPCYVICYAMYNTKQLDYQLEISIAWYTYIVDEGESRIEMEIRERII